MAQRVIAAMGGNVNDAKIAILGLSFKPETDDMRDSPSLKIIPQLLSAGANINAYDPKSMREAKALLPEKVTYKKNALECISGVDAVVIITEWNEFRALTAAHFVNAMRGNIMIDLRNLYEPEKMISAGLSYCSIGR